MDIPKISINYEDFYKFIASLGVLMFFAGLVILSFFMSKGLTTTSQLFPSILLLVYGIVLIYWAGSIWRGKQILIDEVERLKLELQKHELEKKLATKKPKQV